MADVQIENGYTRIANEILDAIAKHPLNGTQHRIIDVIWRYTYGFNRKEAELSESFIAKATGIDRRNIRRELIQLINMNLIIVAKEADFKSPRIIRFNKNYDSWVRVNLPPQGKKASEGKNAATPGGELAPTPEGELTPQERNTLKKTIKKDLSLEIENMRKRYSDFLEQIDEYFDILRTTRLSGKIADSIVYKVYIEMIKYPVIVVKAAVLTVINNPSLHSKRENYFFGIMRNTKADDAEQRVKKYKVEQQSQEGDGAYGYTDFTGKFRD